MTNVIQKNEALQAVHAAKHHGKDQRHHSIRRLQQARKMIAAPVDPIAPPDPFTPIYITGPHPRILWTLDRITRARAWLLNNPRAAYGLLEHAMHYAISGNTISGQVVLENLFNFDVPDSELAGVASDADRWNQHIPVVVDWCWDLVSADPRWPAWKARYDFIRETLRHKDWGSGWMFSSNYNWAYFANEINWAIATGNQELLDWTLDKIGRASCRERV